MDIAVLDNSLECPLLNQAPVEPSWQRSANAIVSVTFSEPSLYVTVHVDHQPGFMRLWTQQRIGTVEVQHFTVNKAEARQKGTLDTEQRNIEVQMH